MASYNQLIKIQKDIADAHLQIRTFGNGDPLNIGNNVTYPLMWSVQQAGSASIAGKYDMHSFVLIFADLVHADQSNEQEVLSDMRLIALDVLSQLQLPDYADLFEVESTARIEPFSHEIPNGNTADHVAGWTLNVSLKTSYLSDHCAVPSTLDPTAVTETVCAPVSVYDQSNNLIATVGAGGTYTVTVLSVIYDDLSGNYTNTIIDNL